MHRAARDAFGSQPQPPCSGGRKGERKSPGTLLKARRNKGWGCPPDLGTDLAEQGKQETAAPTATSMRATTP